ncbi:MAG: polyprenyl synthetase family protein [Gemmataceae bacterium]|nr:polyprenyl synthetase family protein [Gemmataceae bacterium]
MTPRLQQIEAALELSLEQVTGEAPQPLREAMRYSLLAPGKRLRPLLTLLTHEAASGNGDISAALPAACAVEMVHTYSLIHDDLPAMDDDDLRRGRPTCHKVYGEALAILAGDALLTGAFEVLATGYPPARAAVLTVELARAAGAIGMVGGQTLDLQAEGRLPGSSPLPATLATLEDLHRRKTGALIRAAVRLGWLAADPSGGPPPLQEQRAHWVDTFATALGLLFQITDDLLDVEGSEEKTGKRLGKDAARGKLTYPGLVGVEPSRRRVVELGQTAQQAAAALGSGALQRLVQHIMARER